MYSPEMDVGQKIIALSPPEGQNLASEVAELFHRHISVYDHEAVRLFVGDSFTYYAATIRHFVYALPPQPNSILPPVGSYFDMVLMRDIRKESPVFQGEAQLRSYRKKLEGFPDPYNLASTRMTSQVMNYVIALDPTLAHPVVNEALIVSTKGTSSHISPRLSRRRIEDLKGMESNLGDRYIMIDNMGLMDKQASLGDYVSLRIVQQAARSLAVLEAKGLAKFTSALLQTTSYNPGINVEAMVKQIVRERAYLDSLLNVADTVEKHLAAFSQLDDDQKALLDDLALMTHPDIARTSLTSMMRPVINALIAQDWKKAYEALDRLEKRFPDAFPHRKFLHEKKSPDTRDTTALSPEASRIREASERFARDIVETSIRQIGAEYASEKGYTYNPDVPVSATRNPLPLPITMYKAAEFSQPEIILTTFTFRESEGYKIVYQRWMADNTLSTDRHILMHTLVAKLIEARELTVQRLQAVKDSFHDSDRYDEEVLKLSLANVLRDYLRHLTTLPTVKSHEQTLNWLIEELEKR